MAKKRGMVNSPIRKSRLDECVNCSKTDDHSAQKLLAKHSEIDAGWGQAYCTDLTHKSKRFYGDPGAPRTHGKRHVAQEKPVTIRPRWNSPAAKTLDCYPPTSHPRNSGPGH